MEKYWMVHRSGTKAGELHVSYAAAAFEASRLAVLQPDDTFFVMEAVSAHKKRPSVDVIDLHNSATCPA